MKVRARGNAHAPNTFKDNWDIMASALRKYESNGFIQNHDLKATNPDPQLKSFKIEGQINCINGIIIEIDKELGVIRDLHKAEYAVVQTVSYSYHVRLTHPKDPDKSRNLFRYDGHGVRHHECHPDKHHCHEYDDNGKEIKGQGKCTCGKCPTFVGAASWPHISDVVDEAQDWYFAHYNELI